MNKRITESGSRVGLFLISHFSFLILLLSACSPTQRQDDKERLDLLSDQEREWVAENPDYFKELLDLQDSCMAGKQISVRHLQALMPQTEEDYHIFMAIQPYAIIKEGDADVESPQALYLVAGEMAAADTLDMMELYLMWFDWCDGWVSETVWDKALEIEKRHPEKFQQLIKKTRWYWDWQEFRELMLQYEAENS